MIAIWGLAALCGYLAVLMVHDQVPWTTPNTHSLSRYDWYVWGGRLFIHHSYDIDKSESAVRELRFGGWRAKREVFTLLPDDFNVVAGQPPDPIRYVATITLQMPTWPLLLLLGAYPIWVLLLARKRRRDRTRRQGLCIKCLYNLTGNTTGVCPECGTAFERRVET